MVIDNPRSYFGALYPLVKKDSITDIDCSGGQVFLTDSAGRRWLSEIRLSDDFVEQFTKRIANTVSQPFHKQSPILEAHTDTLRITVVHESLAVSGRAICIRKSLPYIRMNEAQMLESGYLTERILNLLKNCVRSHLNMVFCGLPGVGKTELAKFFSQYIPDNERVITIEDVQEWHYSSLGRERDCVELLIGDNMDYTRAIKTCLRLNPKWMMLSEARSEEVRYLIEGFSTGVSGMTTLHTDDVRKLPDRMVNMAGDGYNEKRMENDIYRFIDVAVMIQRRPAADGRSGYSRYISQVCFFTREDGANHIYMMVEDGELIADEVPNEIFKKMCRNRITDPFE